MYEIHTKENDLRKQSYVCRCIYVCVYMYVYIER